MAVALLAKQLFWPTRAAESEYATRGQLKDALSPLIKSHEDLAKYTHDSVHKINDDIHQVRLRQEASRVEVGRDMAAQLAPVISKVDQIAIHMARLVALHDSEHKRRPTEQETDP